MIRRLTYHCFWNFYDYLGTYVISGILHTLLVLGLLSLAGSVFSMALSPLLQWALVILLLLLAIGATGVIAAGLLAFAEKAAYDNPARWPDIKQGVTDRFRPVFKVLILIAVVSVVLYVNIMFYLRAGSGSISQPLRIASTITGMALVWGALTFLLMISPLLASAGSPGVPPMLKAALKRAIVIFALAPLVWVAVGLVCGSLVVFGGITRVGLIFVLPATVCFAQTAHRLIAQYADNLAIAQQELGAGAKLRACKLKAKELGWEWEFRQPRRTFRELIKPWEN